MEGLTEAINLQLTKIAKDYDIELSDHSYAVRFDELIGKLNNSKRVVLLIDEYDKPIIDYLEDIPKAEENRDILKSFYSVIKGNDENLQFVFLTGVSKFSHVSAFSDLNNLNDITTNKFYASMLGYTQNELENYFEGRFREVENSFPRIKDLGQEIKKWYNGYSWDGVNFVYTPFSILKFFSEQDFGNYWYATGTPTFLFKNW